MTSPPLHSFEWNEAQVDRRIERAMFTISATARDGHVEVVGCGFVLKASGTSALAASAAHVFVEVRDLQQGKNLDRFHPSALPDFRPPPKAVDLDLSGLAAVFANGEGVQFGRIVGLAFDEAADVAILQIEDQGGADGTPFDAELLVDDWLPEVGSLVSVLTYADLAYQNLANGRTQMARRAITRVGKVLAVHPDGTRLCRGPCVETTIPIYSGMSGGAAVAYEEGKAIRVFGFVCSDPDVDSPIKQDRSIAGRSILGKLPCVEVTLGRGSERIAQLSFIPSSASGVFTQL